MTERLPELAAVLPTDVLFDGELVALYDEGDFYRLGRRISIYSGMTDKAVSALGAKLEAAGQ